MQSQDFDEVLAIESDTLSPWKPTSGKPESCREQLWVAKRQSSRTSQEILGWCCALLIYPEAELLKIAVKKAVRNQGVGQLLLAHLIGNLLEKQYQSLFLEVRSKNHIALKLYRKNGFIQVGARPKYYSAPDDEALILRKEL